MRSNLLDTLEAIDRVGREYDNCRERLGYDEPEGWDDDGHEAPERPIRFLDVAADFIAISLIGRIPDPEVPVHLQQECLEMLDPCARIRALNAFVVEALDDMMTPDSIYERALRARIKRYARVLEHRRNDDANEDLSSNGSEFRQQRLEDAHAQLDDPVARLRDTLDTCGMPRAVSAVEARAQPPPGQDRREDIGVPPVSGRAAVDPRQGGYARSRTRPRDRCGDGREGRSRLVTKGTGRATGPR